MFLDFEGFEFLGVLGGIFWGCVIASRFLKNGVAIYVDLGNFFWGLGCGLGAVLL